MCRRKRLTKSCRLTERISKKQNLLLKKRKSADRSTREFRGCQQADRRVQRNGYREYPKACDDWKQKSRQQAEADKQKFIHESKVAGYVKGLKLKDEIYENHVTKMLLDKGLQFEGDKLIGADDVVNPFKESHPDAFQSTKPTPTFVAATGTSQEMKLTKEDFRKMGYQDRLSLKSENPELYNELKE